MRLPVQVVGIAVKRHLRVPKNIDVVMGQKRLVVQIANLVIKRHHKKLLLQMNVTNVFLCVLLDIHSPNVQVQGSV